MVPLILLDALMPYIIIAIILVVAYFTLKSKFPSIFGSGAIGDVGADVGKFASGVVVGAAVGTVNAIGAEISKAQKPIGGDCTNDLDCRGYVVGGNGPACDKNTRKCANLHWPRILGEQCNLHTDCKGHIAGGDSLACENKKCVQQMRDWAGTYYIPSECVSGPGRAKGTCANGLTWPRKLDQECRLNTDCEGNLGCEGGKCVQKLRDWAGVYYNPSECRDGPGRDLGSCRSGNSWPRKENQECRLHTDCEGHRAGQDSLACDNSRCVRQKRDWAGVWYIPSECKGGVFSGKGSC